ncbi:MAG: acetate kinase [Acidobacteria bacterium]|nr:acetate kinase [Acidobacteriota bacterium]
MTVKAARPCASVLILNGGSSSIRFAVYESREPLRRLLAGKVDRIGSSGANLTATASPEHSAPRPRRVAAGDHRAAAAVLLQWLEAQPIFSSVRAVGHRVVHGMSRSEPALVTAKLLADLRRNAPYDPDHLPVEIGLMDMLRKRYPRVRQVACFDTAFHRTMPAIARMLPIPRRYANKHVERYGFHGISYAYLMAELERLDPAAARGRVILAHLGSGASLCATRDGLSVDTSMGFTPASGLVMGTRTGDLDPGVAYYLARTEGVSAAQFQQMVNHKSGLLGVSGISSDLRDLLARQGHDRRAAEAVELFCYQVTKWIGSFAAVLGGVDTLVFSAGIGENAPMIRREICHRLGFLGIELDARRNARNAALISPPGGRVSVRVIPTNEELMIARLVIRTLDMSAA